MGNAYIFKDGSISFGGASGILYSNYANRNVIQDANDGCVCRVCSSSFHILSSHILLLSVFILHAAFVCLLLAAFFQSNVLFYLLGRYSNQ